MPTIEIEVKNKIANSPASCLVCGNSDYEISFIFDDEWAEHNVKTARFTYNGKYIDVVFNGNACSVPKIIDTTVCKVGVYAGDLRTTTPATIYCYKSILCADGVPADPQPDVYQQLMERINDGSLKGPKGENGADGYTPQKGIDYFDGQNGKDGYTPVKGVDYFDGKDGNDGADGYSPVRGVDYWTDADKQEVIDSVLSTFPTAEGGRF